MSSSEAEPVVQRVRVIGLSIAEEASLRISQVRSVLLELLDEDDRERRARLVAEARLQLMQVQELLGELQRLEERERICHTLCAPRWPPTAAPTAFSEV